MPTAVFVHPHPDDEAIFTGGSMRRAADGGWRVVLVLATGGEEGTMPDWVTIDAADHRRMETAEAAAVLGAAEVHHLGFRDSGMAGWATNRASGALAASIDEATEALATVLRRCGADAVVGQDPNGIYGHPDHVAVHRVVTAAADAARVDEVLEATIDRRWLGDLRTERIRTGRLDPEAWCAAGLAALGVAPAPGGWRAGTDDEPRPLVRVDLDREREAKQAAMAAHASQVPDAADFMGIPPGIFHRVLAHEWFLRRRPAGGADAAGSLERALAAVPAG
jgi:LmbE family N-acetylglucosaminyl deacetylase